MSKRRGLGRGLGALIPADSTQDSVAGGVRTVPVTIIVPNPHQPRGRMDAEKLEELAASIKAHGLIQPLIVTERPGGFTLIAGERRWRASQLAGLTEVPVVVKETTPQEMLELAIIENIQRADLNALEEALAYRQLMDEFGLTQEEVAAQVGKGRSTVANLVRILTLPEPVQLAVLDGDISGAHARELTRLPTPEMQVNAMRQIVKLQLSRRQTITLVDNLLSEKKPQPKSKPVLSPELKALQTQFEQSLGTRVNIEKGKKGGKVVIH
ncbi:MAG: ParB/RepB/Spo0J family partition protein, partial [Anaerolineales bacterium]|nr:ParB/RepB/Spo0J family partition protein [Anaerolineales bacterium]